MACSRGRGDGVPALLFRPVPLASFIVLRRVDGVLAGTDGVLLRISTTPVHHHYRTSTPSPQVLYAHRRRDERLKFRVNNVTVRV